MQVTFNRWCIDPKGRTPVSVDPRRVACLEHFTEAYPGNDVTEAMPAGTRITMQGKKEFLVQGSVIEVMAALNNMEAGDV